MLTKRKFPAKVSIDDLISLKEAALIAGYSRTSMYNFFQDGSVAAKRFGSEWIVYRPHVIELREKRKKSSRGRPPINQPVDVYLPPQDPAGPGNNQVRRTSLLKRKVESLRKTKGAPARNKNRSQSLLFDRFDGDR